MEFESLKNELIENVKPHSPCASEYKRALSATNEEELLKVIYDNIGWCSETKTVSNEYFAKFDPTIYLQSGIAGTGKDNTGFANSGNWNSGNWNSGDSNSGYRNSGDRNSGYRNSGYSNSGDSNSGDSNSGNWNSGNWNSGDRNSGDSNSGYRNSGAFCTTPDPLMWLFNKPCKTMTVKQWEQTKACNLMYSIDPTIWVQWSAMSGEEQKANPKLEASEGYTKSIPMKEAWANAWGNWSEENRKEFTSLENFDAEIFKEITGITV